MFTNWADRQTSAFTKWINFTFLSNEAYCKDMSGPSDSAAVTSDHSHAFKILALKREEGIVRRNAYRIFHSDDMTRMQCLVDEETINGRLTIRSDKHLYADVGLQEEIINLVSDFSCVSYLRPIYDSWNYFDKV
jgi:hypothetical protein